MSQSQSLPVFLLGMPTDSGVGAFYLGDLREKSEPVLYVDLKVKTLKSQTGQFQMS
jgi:hypothetical protein